MILRRFRISVTCLPRMFKVLMADQFETSFAMFVPRGSVGWYSGPRYWRYRREYRRPWQRRWRRSQWFDRSALTREQLDIEIDEYMGKSRSQLDAEIDAYMANEELDGSYVANEETINCWDWPRLFRPSAETFSLHSKLLSWPLQCLWQTIYCINSKLGNVGFLYLLLLFCQAPLGVCIAKRRH